MSGDDHAHRQIFPITPKISGPQNLLCSLNFKFRPSSGLLGVSLPRHTRRGRAACYPRFAGTEPARFSPLPARRLRPCRVTPADAGTVTRFGFTGSAAPIRNCRKGERKGDAERVSGAPGERKLSPARRGDRPMPHPAPAHKSFADRSSLKEITDKIIAELERGRVPWVQPWAGTAAPLGLPKNIFTGRFYSRINIPDPVVRGRRARLHHPKLAHLQTGAKARRPCQIGRTRHHGRLCRSLYSSPRTRPRR